MNYLPLFHNLTNRPVLLVGGGEQALRKARLLASSGAQLRVVAPMIDPQLAAIAQQCEQRDYCPEDLADVYLVVAATDDPSVNAAVAADAEKLRIAVNVVDAPELCSVIFPAIIDRSPLIVALSSGGVSPVLARLLRARLESLIPAAYGRLAQFAGRFREQVKKALPQLQQRRIFWEDVFQGRIAEYVLSGQEGQAAKQLQEKLQNPASEVRGEVWLVGAGPGDVDLLTFRALRLMQQADVVLYDRLLPEGILELCRRDATRIYVGKRAAEHVAPQEQINQMLIRLAKQGKRVLRLKGGDPFIFGRGGEEIEQLAGEGIPFQVVPGITAASGCAAYAGIPLTHRDYAQSVRFITGHLKNGSCNLPWADLVSPAQTLVVYMGLGGLAHICGQLIAHGRAGETPAALVEQGTTAQQRVICATLADLPEQAAQQQVSAPALLIVGEVVKLRERLAWFAGQSYPPEKPLSEHLA